MIGEHVGQWVRTAGMRTGAALWVQGMLRHQRRDGSWLTGCVVVALDHRVRLLVVDAETPAQTVDRPSPYVQAGDMRDDLLRAVELARVIVGQHSVVIHYQASSGARTTRRLQGVVPLDSGEGIVAHDLDRDAPRSFRLDRISTVNPPTIPGD